MELCSNGHEEVCYKGGNCPVCLEQDAIKELEEENDELKGRIDELKDEIKELQAHE